MRTIFVLIQKEFRQIRRNKFMLPIMFVLPILQLLVLVHATTFEIKHVKLCIVDMDMSNTSQRFVNKLQGSSFFKVTSTTFSFDQAEQQLATNNADMIVYIPDNMSKKLVEEKHASIQFIPNAINSNFASIAFAYAANILLSFNKNLVAECSSGIAPTPIKTINTSTQYWFNPEMNYKWYMFPGIMVILITMIGIFLSGLNVVREKEIGTSEQLNVTPMSKIHFIIGKLLPFLMVGLIELVLATAIGRLAFNVPLIGNIWTLVGFTLIYLFVVLGIGLFVSTLANTQQQMMFIAFFIVIVFILLSGIFTPAESMPIWVQKFNIINPISYFMKVIRMVMLKGAGLNNLVNEIISLCIYAVIIISLATFRYQKTT